jgi:hypothetical protein
MHGVWVSFNFRVGIDIFYMDLQPFGFCSEEGSQEGSENPSRCIPDGKEPAEAGSVTITFA